MLVTQIMPRARERLAVIDAGVRLIEAATMMAKPHVDMIVVCDRGVMSGVVTKTDIVARLAPPMDGSWFSQRVDAVMTRDVASCSEHDPLYKVWRMMCDRGLQRIPVLDPAGAPTGAVYARDLLQLLLSEAEIEDELLRGYIAGTGYR